MTLNEIETRLMQADIGDGPELHEMLVMLVEVVREQQLEINQMKSRELLTVESLGLLRDIVTLQDVEIDTLKSQMSAVHEAVPQTDTSRMAEYAKLGFVVKDLE